MQRYILLQSFAWRRLPAKPRNYLPYTASPAPRIESSSPGMTADRIRLINFCLVIGIFVLYLALALSIILHF
jgi:hypothetical protein